MMLVKVLLSILIPFNLYSCSDFYNSPQFVGKNQAGILSLQQRGVIDSTASGLVFSTESTYSRAKRKAVQIRDSLKAVYLGIKDSVAKEQFLDTVSEIFSQVLLNNIVPYWYGTKWDFEGHTAVPQQGSIACGYFVSTTLKHMGVKLNRYWLAQQGPYNEAKSLAIDTTLVVAIERDTQPIKWSFFLDFSDGLYFVGLDAHVGYLYVKEGNAFFLHSNYLENRVMLEPIQDAEAFISYSYYLTKITGNSALALNWLLNKEVEVYKK